jgi:hypothetical protein
MTQDEIIRSPLKREQLVTLAREAGISEDHALGLKPFLERFAALVAEATKEKMKKVFAVATPKSTWTTDRIIAEIEDMK